ncbi:MAG: hypothetical protein ACOH17_14280 [Cellulomonas sp.]
MADKMTITLPNISDINDAPAEYRYENGGTIVETYGLTELAFDFATGTITVEGHNWSNDTAGIDVDGATVTLRVPPLSADQLLEFLKGIREELAEIRGAVLGGSDDTADAERTIERAIEWLEEPSSTYVGGVEDGRYWLFEVSRATVGWVVDVVGP